jgi:hypothetical protein
MHGTIASHSAIYRRDVFVKLAIDGQAVMNTSDRWTVMTVRNYSITNEYNFIGYEYYVQYDVLRSTSTLEHYKYMNHH